MRIYYYTLDFNDGTSDGCHLKSGAHKSADVETEVHKLAPNAYFEWSDDAETHGLIWESEGAAASKKVEPIGTFSVTEE